MRTIKLTSANISSINNTIGLLIHSGIADACASDMRRDMNERDNRTLDLKVRKATSHLESYRITPANSEFDLRPLTVRLVNDRCYIYDTETDERITSCAHTDTRDLIDEIKSVSGDWSRYIDSMVILNGDGAFKLDERYKFIPAKRSITIDKVIKTLKLDGDVIRIID